jgi:protein-tyrosine phosphatase
MVQVLDWMGAANPHELLAPAVTALASGKLIGVPTETVYGIAASALVPAGVDRLTRGKRRARQKPLALAFANADAALEWVPEITPFGLRLARKCWPGPVTLVFRGGFAGGPVHRLAESVRHCVCPEDTLGLRVPDHPAATEILSAVAAPVVLSSANKRDEPPAVTAEEVARSLGEDLAFVVNGGPSRFRDASTVALVDGNSWRILREGVVSAAELGDMAACRILFVCTGNTCRSPMAAALCRKLLAEELHCSVPELLRQGFIIESAGLSAFEGGTAAMEAIEVTAGFGVDLSGHQTRPLTRALVQRADHLITMTSHHLLAIEARFGRTGATARLLSPEGGDLADPLGCNRETYLYCAREIEGHLKKLVPEIIARERSRP